MNREILTYVYGESIFRTGCLFFYSRTLPFNTRKRCIQFSLGLSFLVVLNLGSLLLKD